MKRDPTDVELFDIAQSNSEHSRHWFFGGNMVIDGEKKPRSLFRIVKDTLTEERRKNSVIAFNDNSSAIRGFEIATIQPECPGKPSKFVQQKFMSHILLSAETHNFPSGVAPFPGAETGTGGRIRDGDHGGLLGGCVDHTVHLVLLMSQAVTHTGTSRHLLTGDVDHPPSSQPCSLSRARSLRITDTIMPEWE